LRERVTGKGEETRGLRNCSAKSQLPVQPCWGISCGKGTCGVDFSIHGRSTRGLTPIIAAKKGKEGEII